MAEAPGFWPVLPSDVEQHNQMAGGAPGAEVPKCELLGGTPGGTLTLGRGSASKARAAPHPYSEAAGTRPCGAGHPVTAHSHNTEPHLQMRTQEAVSPEVAGGPPQAAWWGARRPQLVLETVPLRG